MLSVRSQLFAFSFCLVCCALGQMALADDSADIAAKWKALTDKRDALTTKMNAMQEKFAKATPAEQADMKTEFEAGIAEFREKVIPEMRTVAVKAFDADNTNTEAGQAALELAYSYNEYDTAVRVGDALLKAGVKTPTVKNLTANAKFATHDFEGAQKLYTQASIKGELIPDLGGRFVGEVGPYTEMWQREQKIRETEANAPAGQELPRVLFETTKGPILIELFENEAPNTVANFISLVEAKKYDGVKFHRVIPNFMIQGGDPNTLDRDPANDGQGGPGYLIPCECYAPNARMHFRGTLSMAHAGKDTGGSQFFITHLPTPHLNPNPAQKTGHTVFGRVVEGLDNAMAIAKDDVITTASVVRKRDHEYKPKTIPDTRKR
jgi:cyclophilin family peptidyl-prolyl cis-trans isomerase